MTLDPVQLAADLIRCPSVTPEDAGALDVLQGALEALGFTCTRLPFEEDGTASVDNLYARLGDAAPNFCFAGHTDVVPVGAHGPDQPALSCAVIVKTVDAQTRAKTSVNDLLRD